MIEQLITDALTKERYKKEITSWHPSKLGSCLTGAYLERAGVQADEEFDARTLRVFSAGKHFEEWATGLIKTSGKNVEEQVRIEWPDYNVTGYADLLMDDVVYEIKSKNSRAFWHMVGNARSGRRGTGPSRHHEMQLWVYLKVLGRQRGEIVYISKDDLAIQQYPVYLNDEKLEKEVVRELTILNQAAKELLPPPVTFDEKDWRAKYCRFHQQCTTQPKYLTVTN